MLKIKDRVTNDILVNKYGFSMETISKKQNLHEFRLGEKDSLTLIQRGDKSIYAVIPGDWDTDCTPVSDVVFRLIQDRLVDLVLESDASDKAEEQEGSSPQNPIFIRKLSCPIELEAIRAEWEKRQNEHGEDGSCVIGAGFTFKFKGLYYKMPPQGMWQGSCSWESIKEIVEQMLINAGCENIKYNYGILD